MKPPGPPSPHQRLEIARGLRRDASVGEIRILRTEEMYWTAYLVSSRSSSSWIVHFKRFFAVPSHESLLNIAFLGDILPPDAAAQLFPEYAEREYEAVVTDQGVTRHPSNPTL